MLFLEARAQVSGNAVGGRSRTDLNMAASRQLGDDASAAPRNQRATPDARSADNYCWRWRREARYQLSYKNDIPARGACSSMALAG